jgi:hypothetical protein
MQGSEDAPWASSAPSGDAIDGGPTTGALSTFLPALALCCDRLVHFPLSRLFQAANDASPAGPAFEFLPLALTP